MLGGEIFLLSGILEAKGRVNTREFSHEAVARATDSRFFNPSIAVFHWMVASDVHSIGTGGQHNRKQRARDEKLWREEICYVGANMSYFSADLDLF